MSRKLLALAVALALLGTASGVATASPASGITVDSADDVTTNGPELCSLSDDVGTECSSGGGDDDDGGGGGGGELK